MKKIDKYISKQFLQTIFFALLVFMLVFIIIDMFEKLDDFIDKGVQSYIILKYYVVFLPEIIRLILPVSILLAGLFTVGKMANQNELTAIKASGVSVYRFMIPFVVITFIISLFAVYFGGYVVPAANKERVYIEQNFMQKGLVSAGSNIIFQDTKNRIVTLSYFDIRNNQANRVCIQQFDSTDVNKMVSRIDAQKMKYDTSTAGWIIMKGVKRIFKDDREYEVSFDTLKSVALHFKPEEVIKKQRKPEEMKLSELKEYAIDQLRTGNNPNRIEIEYYSRYAFAFSGLVIILFGLPLSFNKRRGGLAVQFGINLLITFVYLLFMKISQSFGKNGVFDPILTAWLANIIFFAAALINLYRVRK